MTYLHGLMLIGALSILLYSMAHLYINRRRDIFRRDMQDAFARNSDKNQWDTVLKDHSCE